ncbi:hypothetical protein PR202_ga19416 [Eleusine coracana subsp. coracana]|uniref:Uncharacterized protein n=1 Tax=Eleusine coracana subsp. coracana TaxID=191504 RepID=A0AAV5CV96_ELECO|nr:hypothetical protein PR202_ga19416 [Eleusine coracana subsp. coracana]
MERGRSFEVPGALQKIANAKKVGSERRYVITLGAAAFSPTHRRRWLLLLSPAAVTPAATTMTSACTKTSSFSRSSYEYDKNLHKNVSSWHASLLASVCDMAKKP